MYVCMYVCMYVYIYIYIYIYVCICLSGGGRGLRLVDGPQVRRDRLVRERRLESAPEHFFALFKFVVVFY